MYSRRMLAAGARPQPWRHGTHQEAIRDRYWFGLEHMRDETMSKSNPPLWMSKSSAIARYGTAILSVAIAIVFVGLLTVFLHTEPIASSMISAVMFAAWFGGFGPGLLATALAVLAINYYVTPPINSFALKGNLFSLGIAELPRLVLFSIAALFVTFLSSAQRAAAESLRRSRDDLLAALEHQKQIEGVLRHSENVSGRSPTVKPNWQLRLGRPQRQNLPVGGKLPNFWL